MLFPVLPPTLFFVYRTAEVFSEICTYLKLPVRSGFVSFSKLSGDLSMLVRRHILPALYHMSTLFPFSFTKRTPSFPFSAVEICTTFPYVSIISSCLSSSVARSQSVSLTSAIYTLPSKIPMSIEVIDAPLLLITEGASQPLSVLLDIINLLSAFCMNTSLTALLIHTTASATI